MVSRLYGLSERFPGVGRRISIYLSLVLPLLFLIGCSTGADPSTQGAAEPVKIRVATLPILDALPMYVADQQGLFEKNGVDVEFIPAGSAPKRDELINANQADAMINEIVSVMFYNRQSPRVQAVRFARTATSDSALFRLLASGESGIENVEGLKGVQIGVSQGTVIEYLTDRLLEKAGFAPEEVATIAVPDIGQRLALLASGELKAGVLPDPLSSLAVLQGSKVIIDDTTYPEISHSIYTFRKDFIDQNPEAVRGFLAAIEEAVSQINADPAGWGDILVEQKLVPEPLLKDFTVPQFVTSGVPGEEQWQDALEWAMEKGLLDAVVSYQDSVTAAFLP
jgi:NitT/TauT family transport system substrate-binding protein